MRDQGEKITIYIPGGISRRGIKVAEIVNWTGQVFICQREEFENLESEWKDEIEGQGIYILFGRMGDGGKPDIYIAETENIKIQLRMHLMKKDFWEIVFILANKDENVNKTHFKYLEARMMDLAKNADKVNLENRNIPQLPPISRSDQSMAERYLEHAITLLDTLGFSYLQPNREGRSSEKANEAGKSALRDADGNSMREKVSSKDGYGHTERNSRKRTRIEYPRVKDMMAAGVMKAGDVVWFKRTPDQRAILTADGRCEYEGEEMNLVEYGKIVSGWTAVNVYQFFIHGPSGKTIEDLRDRLVESNSDARPKSVSIERPPSDGKKARSIDSTSGIRLYFDNPSIGVNAQGIYSSDGFLVLAGSTGPRETREYVRSHNLVRQKNLLDRGEIELRGDRLCFMQDIRFKSPTMAAEVISGGSQNGRIVWKDKDGKTLKEIQESSS